MMLTRSNDRKVTNSVTASGNSNISNTFGLPSGTAFSCPGATSFCERICYAGKLEKIYKGVRNVLTANFETLLYADYLDGIRGMELLIDNMIKDFVNDCLKRKAPMYFRIHWDGDFFSREYAQAWVNVVFRYPAVEFWVYTRSFVGDVSVIDILHNIPNLHVYLSADNVNINEANRVASQYPGVHIATVAQTFADARETIIDSSRKTYACPENRKSIPLISPKGSACGRCGICPTGRGDVLFSVSKS